MGTAAGRPSVKTNAKPSRSRSRGRGGSRDRAQSPRRGRRPAGCRPHLPVGRRRALRPTRRDTCCATGVRRAFRASEQPGAAAAEPRRRGSGQTRSQPAADPRGLDRGRRVVRPPLRPPARAPRRTRRLRGSPGPRPTRGRPVSRAPGSARRSAAGMQPPRRVRREPALARPTARARLRRAHRDRARPGRGARHDDRGRSPDRWPRPVLGARCGAPSATQPGRSRSAGAGGGTSRVRRPRSGLPPRGRRCVDRDAELGGSPPEEVGITDRIGRRHEQQALRLAREASRSGGDSSLRCGWARATCPGQRSHRRGRPTTAHAGARAGRADCRAPRR